MSTTRLRHPNIDDMTVEVADDDVQSWVDQGWKRDSKTTGKTTTGRAEPGAASQGG